MAINNVTLVGRLTKDPEIKVAGETHVLNFCVAVNKDFQKNDHPDVNWIDCVAWGKTAEFIAKYFKKGNKIGVIGRLDTRKYENSDGKGIKVTEVIVSQVDFVESKAASENNSEFVMNETTEIDTSYLEEGSETDEEDPF